MPAIDLEDDRPKKKCSHEVGQDLTILSVGELPERINLLKNEIGRLEAEMSRKRASQSAADAILKEIAQVVTRLYRERRYLRQMKLNEVKLRKNFGNLLPNLNFWLSFLLHYK